MFIYAFLMDGFTWAAVVDAFAKVPWMMAQQLSNNGALILFLALLGGLVVVIALAGGSRAYGDWVGKHIKNAAMAKLLTSILGVLIFVDDYFNCLTVGAVMRPVTDRFNISREKLAYIIDSTAAPVCIIAPVSSWAVAVSGYLGDGGFATFIQTIPYNFYALLTICAVIYFSLSSKDYGPMRRAEKLAREKGVCDEDGADVSNDNEYDGMAISEKGRVTDLVVPILVLIVVSILGMMYVGDFFAGGVDFGTAIGTDPVSGLCIGAFIALIVAACMYLPRKLMDLPGFMTGVGKGVRSMITAIMILVLAWSLGGECRYMLGTGTFVSGFISGAGIGLDFLPAILFLVSCFLGFSMGTSWGTIGIMLPIVIAIYTGQPDTALLAAVGATLAGAVYGDHCSPISDTTILSSAGARCNHIQHVRTQLPYATTVAAACFVGYIVAGFTSEPWIPLAFAFVILGIAIFVLTRNAERKDAMAVVEGKQA